MQCIVSVSQNPATRLTSRPISPCDGCDVCNVSSMCHRILQQDLPQDLPHRVMAVMYAMHRQRVTESCGDLKLVAVMIQRRYV